MGSESSYSGITSVSSSRNGTHVSENGCESDFMQFESGVRMLTANFTYKEADVLTCLPSCTTPRLQAIHEFQRDVETHTILREWALELMGHGEYTQGYCIHITDPLWSLCKALMLCERQLAVDALGPVGCHCLNKAFFMAIGCFHPPDPEPGDYVGGCQECQRCLRCNG